MSKSVTNHWAVLIGINFYLKRPLSGCVRDAQNIKQYLTAGSTGVDATILTASSPSESNLRLPAEEPKSWPTYENVISSLARVTAEAKPGDFVYIHYSGHGTQMQATTCEYSNKNRGDLALVLFDDVHGSRYLRGQELAGQMKNMVEKGLRVTLVLDCCFSGAVVRHSDLNGESIRGVDFDPHIDAAYPPKLDAGPGYQVNSSPLRDSRMLPRWLVDPSGYTILTACGPHEKAQELKFEGGERSGALSYFLLRALTSLKTSGVEITHQSLYQHLRILFHVYWPQQNPMRYGNKQFTFFGELMSGRDMGFIPVFRTQKDSRLCLGAGYAHGVHEDDEYGIFPINTPENISSNATQAPVNVRVSAVRGLTSDLVGTDPASTVSRVKTGWKAKLLTRLSPAEIPVRLMTSVDNPSEWVAAVKRRRYLYISVENAEDQPCLFNVERNERNEYEILDVSCHEITGLPKIPSDRKWALDSVLDLLEHLATFKYIEGIENRIPTVSFEKSFTICLSDEIGRDCGTVGILDVNHGDELSLTVRNFSSEPLYVAIFNLGPSWQIASLICEGGGGDYIVVPPKNDKNGYTGMERIEWAMIVPDSFREQGQDECEDVIKVFVTNRPTSFAPLVLPKISISADNVDRSVQAHHSQLSDFLSGLGTPFRDAQGDYSAEQWTTRNFIIRTHYNKDIS